MSKLFLLSCLISCSFFSIIFANLTNFVKKNDYRGLHQLLSNPNNYVSLDDLNHADLYNKNLQNQYIKNHPYKALGQALIPYTGMLTIKYLIPMYALFNIKQCTTASYWRTIFGSGIFSLIALSAPTPIRNRICIDILLKNEINSVKKNEIIETIVQNVYQQQTINMYHFFPRLTITELPDEKATSMNNQD